MNGETTNQEMDPRIVGAAPAGAKDRESAAAAVREMFTSIAPRYDLLNHVLSFNIDRLWWWRTARKFDAILRRPNARVLDLCCGTGDMTFALGRRTTSETAQILGADFSHAMLQRAAAKGKRRRCAGSRRMRFAYRFPMHTLVWSLQHSVSETWPTMTPGCGKFLASSLPAESAAFWILESRGA